MQASVRVAYASLFTLFAIYAGHRWFGPDIFYHLSWGRDLVTHAQLLPRPRTLVVQPIPANVYWIFQSLMFLVYGVGQTLGLTLLFALTWLAIAGVWIRVVGLRGAWGPVLLLIFLGLMQLRFEERPEVFAYLFLITLIWRTEALATTDRPIRELILLFVLENLWTGIHGYFALGPLVVVAFLIAHPRRWRRGLAALGMVSLASVTGAFGWNAWRIVWAYAEVGHSLSDLNGELFAPSFWPLIWPTWLFWLAWAATLGLVAHDVWRRRNAFPVLLALGGVILSATAVRNLPLLPLMAASLWRGRLDTRAPALANALARAVILAALVLAVRFISPAREAGDLNSFGIGEEWASYPIGVAAHLRAMNFRGRLFCDSYDGGYLEWNLPQIQVAGDSYFADATTTRAYFTAIREPAVFAVWLARDHYDALVLNVENFRVVDQILSDPQWQLAYADSHRALFLPAGQTPAVDPAQIQFRPPGSLLNRNNAFGPMTWAAIAAHRGWRDVLIKIVRDLTPAADVPAALVLPIYHFALEHRDAALLGELNKIRAGTDRVSELHALIETRIKAEECCR